MNGKSSKLLLLMTGVIFFVGCGTNTSTSEENTAVSENTSTYAGDYKEDNKESVVEKKFSAEHIDLANTNWEKEYKFLHPRYVASSDEWVRDSIPMVYARILTDKGPMLVYADHNKIMVSHAAFEKPFSQINISNTQATHSLNWDKSESQNLTVVITDVESYNDLLQMFDDGEFNLIVGDEQIHIPDNGRGIECAIYELLK